MTDGIRKFEPTPENLAPVERHLSEIQSSGGKGEAVVVAPLPEIESAAEALATIDSFTLPEEIVSGLLHRGSKMILGGGSKSFKTWVQIDLAISVATGTPFWKQETAQSRVLLVNLEIQAPFLWRRVQAIVEAKGVSVPDDLDVWNLRGHSAAAEILLPKIIQRVETVGVETVDVEYGLIILDPIYKILGDRDENSAGDVAGLLNELEALAVRTGAAVVFGAHFAKGNASQKEAIDRVSGSGTFARDPDSIVMMTAHEESGAFTVETILRNMPPLEPFVVRRQHPLMVRDESLDPAKLKQVAVKKKRTVEEILALLPSEGATATEWLKLASQEAGISKTRFYELKKDGESGIPER